MSGGYMPSPLFAPRAEESNSQPETRDLLDNIRSDDTNEHLQHQYSPELSFITDSSFSGTVSDQQRSHHPHPKKCRFKGCSKGARKASGLCLAHGGGQRCQKPGCNKGAESPTAYCKAHGGGRRCQQLGCTKRAEGRTDYCKAHGGGQRCGYHLGCTRAARGKSGLCIRHGGGKRCTVEGCTRSAEGQAGLCVSHGGGRRCQYLGCSKRAQGSTMFCKAHASKQKDETSYAEVLNLTEPTSEYKAGSSTTPIDSLFSDARLSLCREAPIYGRDDVKKKVIEFLSADDCMDHNVSIIRIVGIGGVGKSTLVKRVYDELIPYAIFEARAWVSVNERLDIKGITKAVIESLAGTSCGLTELREVQEVVREELMGKRFLLVLDNVCDDAPNFWSSLLVPLSVGAKGSILIATARSGKESVMDTTQHLKLNRLSENECWLVFQQQIFDRRGQKVCSNLIEIGKQIITRCEGLPLAVKAFGGLLQSDLNERSWNAVLESNLWNEDGNLPALRVCCDHLTVHLQQCFQYCSLFPKGYMFDKDHLIRLWMSQGFIENEEGKHGHDLGCKYFNEMLEMSFFQLSPVLDPIEKKYMMHDLCHDLAQSLSLNKCLRTETCKLSNIPDAICHVSLVPSGSDTTLQFASLRELKDIHTLLLINSSIMKWEASILHVEDPKILNDLFSRFGCLRTLDLSFTDIEEVPESIVNLQHLCYLALNRTNIRKIPESICSLYNLQTLELQGCNYLSELPTHLKNLTNLQHLDVCKDSGFISMPPGIGHLTGLRTLSAFTVGRGQQWCGIRELKDLMKLGGAFCIGGLCNVVNGEEAEVAQLKMKKNLRTLTLQWFNCGEDLEDDQSAETASEVLQSLQPHNNLEELTLRDYSGDHFPSWIADPSFLKLMSITLDNCYECNNLPLLGQLPSLKHLSIRMMDGIQRLGREFCGSGPSMGFQSLETLKLWDMPELIEWSGVEEEYFPRLCNFSISRCNKLRGLPCFSSLLELSIHCCTQLPDLPTLQSLKSLKIDGLQILPLPQLNLPALEILEISNCNQLLLEDSLSHLPSLRQLKVIRCPEFNFSPSGKLPSTLQVVEIRGSCALLSSWCPDGFGEITDAHQARRKFVRCKTTKQGNSVDDFSTCQVVGSEMLSFGTTGEEMPAKTPVEGSSSGLTTVGSTGQRQSKKRKKRMWTVRVSAAQIGNMKNLPDDGYTWRKYGQKEIPGSKFPRSYFWCAHKNFNGCDATKQVQRADEDPYTYEITYCGDHSCQTSTKLRNSESEQMEHLQVADSEMRSFGAIGGELPTTTAVEESSSGLTVGSTVQRQSKMRKKRMWTVRVSAAQAGNMENLPDDGYTWRKNGQKEILGSKFPRSYFRCAHKNLYGCDAKKQVQRADEDPYTYEITYWGDHSCQTSTKLRNSESERMEHLQVADSEMPSFGAIGGELPATTAVEGSSSGLTAVGSTVQTSTKEPISYLDDLMDAVFVYEGVDAVFEYEGERTSDG